jgi:uncharacterized protein YdhG (YjbR/CyaY superfamily)
LEFGVDPLTKFKSMKTAKSVQEYIGLYPKSVQSLLKQMRAMIKEVAPDAIESISYGMPAYKYNKKPLVYFGGYAHHIGFYATPNTHIAFAEKLKGYKQGKGAVQFPLDKPLPITLIKSMVRFRIRSLQST